MADESGSAAQTVSQTIDCSGSSVASTTAVKAAVNESSVSASATGAASSSVASSASSAENLQTFTGQLGGAAPAVTAGGRGFIVEGSDEFVGVIH